MPEKYIGNTYNFKDYANLENVILPKNNILNLCSCKIFINEKPKKGTKFEKDVRTGKKYTYRYLSYANVDLNFGNLIIKRIHIAPKRNLMYLSPFQLSQYDLDIIFPIVEIEKGKYAYEVFPTNRDISVNLNKFITYCFLKERVKLESYKEEQKKQ